MMNHKTLTKTQRYGLLFIVLACLIWVGSGLLRSWNLTPENHYYEAIALIEKHQENKAIPHLLVAQKSQDESIALMSILNLANLYHHGAKNVPANVQKAAYYYELAAAKNHPQSLYTLALLYNAGDKIPENREKAKDYIQKAATFLPEAKYVWAVWLENGYFGAKDTKKAVALYEQAAEAGIQNAMKSLIAIYHNGFGGFPKNIQKENHWRHKLESTSKKNDFL